MARYTGPVCRLCRRENEKLFLKGKRCFTEKCALERKAYPPGQHGTGRRRRRSSEYATQLREKQKVKRIYGVGEKQFRTLFVKAASVKGITGENLLISLEARLDNIVYRLGFAPSRKAARQLVRHRHVRVDGATVDIPSFQVSPGQEISIAPAAQGRKLVLATSIAETSLTIEGITTVIDAGLMRLPRFDPRSGTQTAHESS